MKLVLCGVILISLGALVHSLPFQIDNIVKTESEYDDLTVNTQSGQIKGVAYVAKKPFGREERVMDGWIGIPYAQAPVGDLRFKAPQPNKWDGVIETKDFPPPCFQVDVTKGIPDPEPFGTEDCLYLNVWAPHTRPKKTAVMVWIHGGAFVYLSPARHDPAVLVTTQDVIFVSIQYRHNIFGYLYLNDTENAPGNQALLDHVLALKWVKENIASFGGDPDQISVYGGSSGSVSINYHLLSPLTDNLFANVIMQSGAHPLVPLPSPAKTISSYTHFLDELGCYEGTVAERVACAREKPTVDVFEAAMRVGCIQYGPVIDGHYLPDDPKKLMEEGKFKKVPIMLGVNKNEASLLFLSQFKLADYQDFSKKPKLFYPKFEYYLKNIFWNTLQTPLRPGATDSILFEYTTFPNKNDLDKNYDNLDYSFGDYLFRCPTVNVANYFAQQNVSVFFYHFVEGSSNLTASGVPPWFGAVHGGEIEYMFGDPLKYRSNYKLHEKVLADKMVQYWANFAKYDNPNGRANDQAPREWPVYSTQTPTGNEKNKAYIILDGFRIKKDYGFNEEVCKFWNDFIDKISKQQ